MSQSSESKPAGKARTIGIVLLVVIFVVLAIFLLIAWLSGDDPSNDPDDQQPTPSAAVSPS